jgi:23S rRNA (adenine2030-N6)-methyltransferase
MFVINPPWTLEQTLADTLPAMAQLLAQGPGARHTLISRAT